ncbi:MAG TPA: hypothetical protein VFR09_02150, partial [Alphaproteobacteria bacterium]|nr:hypothetical protein [Alphaproteobacteria bacterium]
QKETGADLASAQTRFNQANNSLSRRMGDGLTERAPTPPEAFTSPAQSEAAVARQAIADEIAATHTSLSGRVGPFGGARGASSAAQNAATAAVRADNAATEASALSEYVEHLAGPNPRGALKTLVRRTSDLATGLEETATSTATKSDAAFTTLRRMGVNVSQMPAPRPAAALQPANGVAPEPVTGAAEPLAPLNDNAALREPSPESVDAVRHAFEDYRDAQAAQTQFANTFNSPEQVALREEAARLRGLSDDFNLHATDAQIQANLARNAADASAAEATGANLEYRDLAADFIGKQRKLDNFSADFMQRFYADRPANWFDGARARFDMWREGRLTRDASAARDAAQDAFRGRGIARAGAADDAAAATRADAGAAQAQLNAEQIGDDATEAAARARPAQGNLENVNQRVDEAATRLRQAHSDMVRSTLPETPVPDPALAAPHAPVPGGAANVAADARAVSTVTRDANALRGAANVARVGGLGRTLSGVTRALTPVFEVASAGARLLGVGGAIVGAGFAGAQMFSDLGSVIDRRVFHGDGKTGAFWGGVGGAVVGVGLMVFGGEIGAAVVGVGYGLYLAGRAGYAGYQALQHGKGWGGAASAAWGDLYDRSGLHSLVSLAGNAWDFVTGHHPAPQAAAAHAGANNGANTATRAPVVQPQPGQQPHQQIIVQRAPVVAAAAAPPPPAAAAAAGAPPTGGGVASSTEDTDQPPPTHGGSVIDGIVAAGETGAGINHVVAGTTQSTAVATNTNGAADTANAAAHVADSTTNVVTATNTSTATVQLSDAEKAIDAQIARDAQANGANSFSVQGGSTEHVAAVIADLKADLQANGLLNAEVNGAAPDARGSVVRTYGLGSLRLENANGTTAETATNDTTTTNGVNADQSQLFAGNGRTNRNKGALTSTDTSEQPHQLAAVTTPAPKKDSVIPRATNTIGVG